LRNVKKIGSTRWRDDFFCCFLGCSRKVASSRPAPSMSGDSKMRAQKYREVGGRGPVLENSGGADPSVHAHWDAGAAAEGLSQLRSTLSPASAARPKPRNCGAPPEVPNPSTRRAAAMGFTSLHPNFLIEVGGFAHFHGFWVLQAVWARGKQRGFSP